MVETNLKEIGITYEEVIAISLSKEKRQRNTISGCARNAALQELITTLKTHTEVNSIRYHKLEMQLPSEQLSLSRRGENTDNFQIAVHQMYQKQFP